MVERSPFALNEDASDNCLVVIPTFIERENLQLLLPRLIDLGPQYFILVVDDNSPDGTADLVKENMHVYPGRLALLQRPEKMGIGRAYVDGFRFVRPLQFDAIATMDADLSHDPADLPRLLAALGQADLVLGSRYVPGGSTVGWPRHRLLLSQFGSWYARTILGSTIHDLTSGFKVYRRSAFDQLDLDSITGDGYVFQIETTYQMLRNGLRIVEVPIAFVDRVAGRSKLSRRIVAEAMVVVWKLRLAELRNH